VGGITASRLTLETKACSFRANIKAQALDIRFNLASKGGGTTSVLVRIGLDDLPLILEAIACRMPECVGVLSDCAAVASKKNLEQLREAKSVQADEQARAKSLVEKMARVEEYVWEKFDEALDGEGKQETKVIEQLEDMIKYLRQLS
jgi:hypothetical protein